MSALIPGVLIALGAVFFVLYPIVAGREAAMEWSDEELTEAQHRRNVALLSLRDVEYDFHAGKLDETDYRALKQQISSEALEAIDEEEVEWLVRQAAGSAQGGTTTQTGVPDDLEAEIAALRASIREGVVCPQCGHPNPRGSRFCGDCGSALPVMTGTAGGS